VDTKTVNAVNSRFAKNSSLKVLVLSSLATTGSVGAVRVFERSRQAPLLPRNVAGSTDVKV
jgi:hypothetical protein